MKRIILLSALFISLSIFNNVSAQHINVNINIGNQPAWGPVGYDYARFYYFPDIDCYYDVNLSLFYFWDRDNWVSARYLPYNYHNYNLYRTYKVVINDHNPWRYHRNHRKMYSKYRGNHSQVVIYNSKDRRYKNSRNNRVEWLAPEHRSNNNSRNNNRGNNYNNRQHNNRNNYAHDNRQNYSRNNQNYSKRENDSNRRSNSANNNRNSQNYNSREKRNNSSNNSRSNYNNSLRNTSNRQQSEQKSSNRSNNRSQSSSSRVVAERR